MSDPIAHYPQAGEQKRGLGVNHLALAPLPIATGYPAIPQETNIKDATETTLDHGRGNYWGFEFGVRFDLTMVWVVFLAIFLTHILAIIAELKYATFIEAIIRTTKEIFPYYAIIVGGTFIFMLAVAVYAYFKASKQVPLRFNREKRQVYAVAGKEHMIADWEAISVQVETALMVSPQMAIQQCTLIFQIPDHVTGRQATLSMGYASEALAIADWEAIRVFMEEGLSALKQQSQPPDTLQPEALKQLLDNPQPTAEYYEQLMNQYTYGSLEYFYATKNYNKYSPSKLNYYFWLFCHSMTAWTLPCHLAKWLNDKNYIRRPNALLDWSKPIPQTQWAKPSQALLIQNQQLQTSYQNGIKNFKDYFTHSDNDYLTESQ